MNCDELRERIVDPASASLGGHAPVVEHLQDCASCREAARDYAAIDRVLRPVAPVAAPPDIEGRLWQRLSAAPTGPWWRSPAAIAAAAVVVLVAAGVGWRSLRRPPAPARAAPEKAAPAPAPVRAVPDERPPDIVAVRSTPISLDRPPLSNQERGAAAALYDFDFLNMFETLARLDAFFPEPVGPRAPIAAPPGGFPSRPPDTPAALTGRYLDWQNAGAKERARLTALDASFRNRPDDERALLEERWSVVREFSDEQRAGLRRLASRLDEMDARTHDRLESEIRLIGRLPKEQRVARWRSLPFAKPLTGQEMEGAERLLLSR